MDIHLDINALLGSVYNFLGHLDQVMVQSLVELEVLRLRAADDVDTRPQVERVLQHEPQVERAGLVVAGLGGLDEVGTPDELLEGAHTERSHVTTDLLGHHEHVVDDVLRVTGELPAKHRVLRGDSDRAGVQVAFAHHRAAHYDQGGGAEADFVGAEQGGNHHVKT